LPFPFEKRAQLKELTGGPFSLCIVRWRNQMG
jgi:hypothetical protein